MYVLLEVLYSVLVFLGMDKVLNFGVMEVYMVKGNVWILNIYKFYFELLSINDVVIVIKF